MFSVHLSKQVFLVTTAFRGLGERKGESTSLLDSPFPPNPGKDVVSIRSVDV